jgi:hypothetical protein
LKDEIEKKKLKKGPKKCQVNLSNS